MRPGLFYFFGMSLLQSVIQVYQEANVPSGQAWGEILHKVNAFTDLILLHLLETYHALERWLTGDRKTLIMPHSDLSTIV